MKRNFLVLVGICFLFLFAGQANAQKEEYNKAMRYRYMPYEKQVEEVLTNLTDNQRKMLHKLSKENKEYMDKYRKDRDQLEKTIKSLLEMKGDVSETLYPLIDMKARLEAEKEKNLYKMKLKIDEILTPEQRIEMEKYYEDMEEVAKKHREEIRQKTKGKTCEERLKEHINSLQQRVD